MKTEELIRLMAEDDRRPVRLPRRVVAGLVAGGLLSVILLLVTIGLRPNLAQAVYSWRVELKMATTAIMAVIGLRLAMHAGIPGERAAGRFLWLALPAAMIGAGIAADLTLLPAADWARAWLGRHAAFCVFFIPVLSVAPLVGLVLALRHGAPDDPARAGSIAGLAAGCLAAAVYAWHCPDDSPLFVTWYLVGISISTVAGWFAGRRLLRW